jgi:mannitol/fructose-specific phosphotransferase system IIA component (Ntr-type)
MADLCRLGFGLMHLRDFFTPEAVGLDLVASTKADAISAYVDPRTGATLLKVLMRREEVGSTGFGRGIAIPHCRSLVVARLRLAYGRFPAGIDFDAIDGQPVHHVFLITAPPHEVSNQYLPVLGRLAQFAKDPGVSQRLAELATPADFLALLETMRA